MKLKDCFSKLKDCFSKSYRRINTIINESLTGKGKRIRRYTISSAPGGAEVYSQDVYFILKAKKGNSLLDVKRNFKSGTSSKVTLWDHDYATSQRTDEQLGVPHFDSYNHTYYNAGCINTRGMEAAIKHQASIYILELLKALTAYKLGRSDLVMKPSAFQSSKYLNFQLIMPKLAENAGFQIFKNIGL